MNITEPGRTTRRAGILLHPTSLPGAGPNGTLGQEARRFIDFLRSAQQTVWQVLPLSPPGAGNSPYASRSAFAGGQHLVDAREPVEHVPAEYEAFREASASWIEDWTLFESLRKRQKLAPWWRWPRELAQRDPAALAAARKSLTSEIAAESDLQWRFWQQWQRLRDHAHEQGIEVLGDIPIFVDHDSADVWANQSQFKLTATGETSVVAGVPPDLFSETGQRWGNPLYDWDAMAADGYAWWTERMRWSLQMFDFVRIDHFRGFEAAWAIPASSPTAIVGEWIPGPGQALFDAMAAKLGPLPMVAEDLGIITKEVTALRKAIDSPGMAVLQFAFGNDATNPYLPHNLEQDCVVYSGTHDNDTTLAWLRGLDTGAYEHLRSYIGREPSVRELVRTAYASVARTAIVAMQDVLELGPEARMNLPGTATGNWGWRFSWDQVTQEHADWLSRLVHTYGRSGMPRGSE